MAINEIPAPSSGASSNNDDYTKQNNLTDAALLKEINIFANWENTSTEPVVGQGVIIRHGGMVYEVQGSDEPISGTPAAGNNYVRATVTGTVMTLAWVTSLSGYSYNPQYQGIYNSTGEQILNSLCYKDGSLLHRAVGCHTDFNVIRVSNGDIISNGDINTQGGSVAVGELSATTILPDQSNSGSWSISAGASRTLERGFWMVSQGAQIEIYVLGSWRAAGAVTNVGGIMSSGVNVRLRNTTGSDRIIYWIKY